jgi:hypothetical protein
MKNLKSILFAAAFVLITLVAPASTPVHAQSGSGDSQLDSMIAKLTEAAATLDDQGYTVVNFTIDNGLKGEKYITQRKLYTGNDYKIMGVGGDGIVDLDISLLDGDGNVVDKDTLNNATPTVQASIDKSDQYYFQTVISELEKGQSNDDSYFYGYVIGFKNQDQPSTDATAQGTNS